MGQRRERTRHNSKAPQRDPEERPYDFRGEMCSGAAGQLGAGIADRHGLLVGTSRRHDLIGVGHGDDRCGPGDLRPDEALGIARPVPFLVVPADRRHPFAEEWAKRRDQIHPGVGVPLEHGPFLVGGLAGFVEDLVGHHQLAEIVQEGTPLELLSLLGRQLHLLAQQIGVQTHPFRMATGAAVVVADRPDELDHLAGRIARVGSQAVGSRLLHGALKSPAAPGAQRGTKAGRRLIRKHQRQLHERCQRQEPAGDLVSEANRNGRDRHHQQRSRHGADHGVGIGQGEARGDRRGGSGRQRHQKCCDTKQAGGHRACTPRTILGWKN